MPRKRKSDTPVRKYVRVKPYTRAKVYAKVSDESRYNAITKGKVGWNKRLEAGTSIWASDGTRNKPPEQRIGFKTRIKWRTIVALKNHHPRIYEWIMKRNLHNAKNGLPTDMDFRI